MNLKFLRNRLVHHTLVGNTVWDAMGKMLRKSGYLRARRSAWLEEHYARALLSLFAQCEVLYGPFFGLKYPDLQAAGSALPPKLLGTYENELHDVVHGWTHIPYQHVYNWGCAEGYYLIGLARKLPGIRTVGIDPDPFALQATRAMARANRISSDRLELHASADLHLLEPYHHERALIIVDCEGYEAKLFSQNLHLLHHADLLIECHDFVVPHITRTLEERLASTHQCRLIHATARSIDDLPSELCEQVKQRFNPSHWPRLVNEGRPPGMTWLWAQSRPPPPPST